MPDSTPAPVLPLDLAATEEPTSRPNFLLGLDLGQRRDYSALVIAERVPPGGSEAAYHLRWLQRWRLGTNYGIVVECVRELLQRPPLLGNARLVLDETGVGVPVREQFDRAGLPCQIVPVMITGGSTVGEDGRSYTVPKQILCATVEVLLQNRRLRIAPALPDAATLTRELQNFEVRISASGNAQFGTWRENEHDDLVLATALACWYGERFPPPASAGTRYVRGAYSADRRTVMARFAPRRRLI